MKSRVPEVRVVLHDVPQDRLLPDRDHRLRDALGGFAHPQPEPAAEQHDLHQDLSTSLGIGTTNCAPHSRDVRELRDDLVLEVPGQDQDVVRARLARCAPARWIGMCVPGMNRPCLYGLRSTV